MLKELKMKSVGPGPLFQARFARRMNIFTGDNGLGKSFLLEVAWWAMTGTWPGIPAQPLPEQSGLPLITATFGTGKSAEVRLTSRYEFRRQQWVRPRQHLLSSALMVYARADGGFSIFDQTRRFPIVDSTSSWAVSDSIFEPVTTHTINLSKEQLWNGLEVGSEFPCEGLVRDWVRWQRESNGDAERPYQTLKQVVETLAPHPQEWIRIAEPERISAKDSRDIPMIQLPYGATPVTLASEGMKRILGLAYALVWAWYEHRQSARLARRPPAKQLILFVDEIESHLHPLWQRSILPALLGVNRALGKAVRIQHLLTTHAPLVLASVEPLFCEGEDQLFLFEEKDGNASLRRVPWAAQGDAVGWLTSEVFGLKQARSREAEAAIEAAEAFMRNDVQHLPSDLRTKRQISQALRKFVVGHDPFWPRWIVQGEGEVK